MTLQTIFLIHGWLMRHPFIELFHLSNFLQMPNDQRMVDIEFFSNFSCSCKRILFDDRSQLSLSTYDGQSLHSSSSRFSYPLQNFLNYHCTVHSLAVPGPNVLLMFWVVSAAFQHNENLNKKTAQICHLSSILSIV